MPSSHQINQLNQLLYFPHVLKLDHALAACRFSTNLESLQSHSKTVARPTRGASELLASKDSLGLREPPRRFISFKPRGAMAFLTAVLSHGSLDHQG
jgi:hypothetical protein